ncbi:putative mitochondrial protein [Cucumis melo var. makuwa]|uniref:Mitochondrial protein n=1 Tax=Cucumis melo var. makuwa TaxID=1194695 RepID=A0A5A7TFD6_CUCMM|nr:putative mitochondrial protein [Cucumis melo var. makuwa]TYK30535.1 putative mitochondrial protein [Cucumis melo var. makuwa]
MPKIAMDSTATLIILDDSGFSEKQTSSKGLTKHHHGKGDAFSRGGCGDCETHPVETEMPDVDEFAQCTRVSCDRGIPDALADPKGQRPSSPYCLAARRHQADCALALSVTRFKPISCKWVYKVKRGSDGSVEGTRLLARAFSQQYGIDYDETARGKAKMTTM